MSWEENINTIKEIFPGQYQVILDFATNKFVEYILDDRYKYAWVFNHYITGSIEWHQYNLPLYNNKENFPVLARQITFDFVMPTSEFGKVLPMLSPGITLIQLNELPKYYLDLKKIDGKTRYELLRKECDYLFEIDLPSATDYGTLISPNKKWLESLFNNKSINWNDLP
jgi:hypothetical protein